MTVKMAARESGRIKDAEKRKVLDEVARVRRARKALEALEHDNFHEDPHADLVMSKKVPKFADSNEKAKRKKSKGAEYYKMRFKKNFGQLLEEELSYNPDPPNYMSVQAPASQRPERSWCGVCGAAAPYRCVPCGARYCCLRCLGTHLDTRCLKWTA